MTLQSPAYALQNSTTHSAALFRQAVSSLLAQAGPLASTELTVAQQSTANMSVLVSAGRAWIPGSQVGMVSGQSFSTQASYFALNDAPVTLTVAAADATNPRVDLVYIAVQDAFYSGSNNQPILGVVTGTPAASPQTPAVPANGIGLATVAVAANATSITNANITALAGALALVRGGTYVCTSSTRPGSPYAGLGIYETDTGHEYVWNGSSWIFGDGAQVNCRVLAASQSLSTSTDAKLTCFASSAQSDPDGMWDGVNKVLTIRRTGNWRIYAQLAMGGTQNATTWIIGRVIKSTSQTSPPTNSIANEGHITGEAYLTFEYDGPLNAGDQLTFQYWTNGSPSIVASSFGAPGFLFADYRGQ